MANGEIDGMVTDNDIVDMVTHGEEDKENLISHSETFKVHCIISSLPFHISHSTNLVIF